MSMMEGTEAFPGADDSLELDDAEPDTPEVALPELRRGGNAEVIFKGWLTKEGNSVKSWKRRWFVLTTDAVAYYKTDSAKSPLGAFPLSSVLTVELARGRAEVNCFAIVTATRAYFVCAPSEQALEEWLFAFKYALEELRPPSSAQEGTSVGDDVGAPAAQDRGRSNTFTSTLASRALALRTRLTESSAIANVSSHIERLLSPRRTERIGTPRRAGFLTKQGQSVKSWKKRWFVLDDASLWYFKDQRAAEMQTPLGRIPLSRVTNCRATDAGALTFEVCTASRTYPILASSENELGEWLTAVTAAWQARRAAIAEGQASSASEDDTSDEDEDGVDDAPARSDSPRLRDTPPRVDSPRPRVSSSEPRPRVSSRAASIASARGSDSADPPMKKVGFLTKRGDTVKSWKRRWFVADDTSLAYYKTNRPSEAAIKSLPMATCTAIVESQLTDRPYVFEVHMPSRTFYIAADSRAEMDAWISFLRAVRTRLFASQE